MDSLLDYIRSLFPLLSGAGIVCLLVWLGVKLAGVEGVTAGGIVVVGAIYTVASLMLSMIFNYTVLPGAVIIYTLGICVLFLLIRFLFETSNREALLSLVPLLGTSGLFLVYEFLNRLSKKVPWIGIIVSAAVLGLLISRYISRGQKGKSD